MVGVPATLALLCLVAHSSTSAAASTGHGGAPSRAFLTRGRRSSALASSQARSYNPGPTTQGQCGHREDALETRALVVRGGSDEDPSLTTLFMRVLMPGFRRDTGGDGELDLEGGGLMRRLKQLVSGVFRKVRGSPVASTESEGEAKNVTTKKKSKGKAKGAKTASHLEKTYRPGNANYRIQKELKEFMANPPDCCKVSVGKNIRVWIITISGAEGTIYAGEKFRLRVSFPEEYPTKPPAVYFLQSPPPPKHQHIYTNGDICLSLLSSRDWKPNLTVMSLALSILSMLSSAKEKRLPEDNATHAEARPGQAQQWIYHDDLC
ncbi:unnamed protein product [Ectocarpus fasciculatus]